MAAATLDAEEAALREILGDVVFGVDDETMEAAVGKLLIEQGLTLGLAESYTGGLIASRIVAVPGASRWFTGGLVSYQSAVKFSVLGVPEGPGGLTRGGDGDGNWRAGAPRLRCRARNDRASQVPTRKTGTNQAPSSSGSRCPARSRSGRSLQLFGGRGGIREMGTINSLDYLRHRLLERGRSNILP